MQMRRSLALVAAFAAAAPSLFAGTINVPADYPTIQAAINAAANGDLIKIAPGTFKENLDTLGKAITLQGSGSKFVTTVDGQQLGSCLKMASGEGAATIITAISFKNGSGTKIGSATYGGGIYIANHSSPTLTDVGVGFCAATYGAGVYVAAGCTPAFSNDRITNNFTANKGAGGGMYVAGAATIDRTRIAENGAPSGTGGGAYIYESKATFTNNTVTQNFAFYGGGVQVHKGAPVVTGNLFDRNTVLNAPQNGEGAGIGITGKATPFVSANEFTLNTAHNGGGVYAYDAAPTLTLNLIHDNDASLGLGYGGGVSFGKVGAAAALSLNQIYANTANQGGGVATRGNTLATLYGNVIDTNLATGTNGTGGGLYSLDSKPQVIANTMVFNGANDGGGIFAKGKSAPVVDTTIVFFNSAGANASIYDGTGLMLISFSDIEGSLVGGSSLSIDPLFANPGARDYSLSATSPVLDAGNVSLNPGGTDLNGNPRVQNGRIDMGAIE